MRYVVTSKLRISGLEHETLPPEDVERVVQAIMDHLATLGAVDPDIGGSLATGHIHMATLVEAEDDLEAIHKASGLMRTAIHATGGRTPDWWVSEVTFGVEADEQPVPLVEA